MARAQTQTPFTEELPRLLRERGMTQTEMARLLGVSAPYLSRVLRKKDYKTPSRDLLRRSAVILGLPDDYFAEYRESLLLELIRTQPNVRDALYDRHVATERSQT